MRYLLIASAILLGPLSSAHAQLSVGFAAPGISIGINVPVYPELVVVPGYPVYYDPRATSNYFFYDGMYWVYAQDTWYSSNWYNGPWQPVGPEYVPLFVLRVPVRYYGQPPGYFRGWSADAAPRWGDRWGRDWSRRRGGWDQWDRRSAPAVAPLPIYQRQYSGERYPRAPEQQQAIRSENYRYQPHEAVGQQHSEPQTKSSHPRVVQQAPVQPRSTVQQQPQPNPQLQQHQSEQRPPAQAARPAQPAVAMHQEQALQPPPPIQPARAEPQYKGRENTAAPENSGGQTRGAPQDSGRENKNEDRSEEHR